jgi:hypothetical protein
MRHAHRDLFRRKLTDNRWCWAATGHWQAPALEPDLRKTRTVGANLPHPAELCEARSKRAKLARDCWDGEGTTGFFHAEYRRRDLAMFNPAIDSKLRGCDLVRIGLSDACIGGCPRAILSTLISIYLRHTD